MSSVEERLDPSRFLRVHRSAIVQLQSVKELRTGEHGDYVLELASGQTLRVSRSHRETVLERMGMRW